ncbi:exodeoxyribonuclease V subunit gamma [Undibacterium jejuense]|uniref:RecBCD enzyme subunit RecC n=1 Tax=Undibacterium jejuense TaxID=1344949 RepID=A0A923HR39_9BURK|nr:exodeoxyribonuclease V subunit gamma [Undibacterium jejuense]MBC3864171.1 exodeoxyribonuclease V subunit gamma [Undibacterium jejuense]
MAPVIKPGLIILHGNQLELLQEAVFDWIKRYPLNPLEKDIFLVQSNGVAEWLKIALAENAGICAANRIELPGRFLWMVYRSMLGRSEIPSSSFLDKSPLTWRLMRLIPELLGDTDFLPLSNFLANGDAERRLQLAARLADLIDLYQMYRTDWLIDWSQGNNRLNRASSDALPLSDDQVWQAKLWRAILQDIPEHERQLGRVNVHQRFIDAIHSGKKPQAALPRRVILFGVSALPRQTLEALSALSVYTQVILAVPNPCQFYWGDIIDGRELLKSQFKRQKNRNDIDLSSVPLAQLHIHSNPLLASWGKLGRDFIRMLDEFDQVEQTRSNFSSLKIDLFSEEASTHLLGQVQNAIRDLSPIDEVERKSISAQDQSIEFHVAHSVQREVEVLHDRLLSILANANPGQHVIQPKDIVVMVPDIAVFSAPIRAVFAQYKRHDARYIPFEIADASDRKNNPLLLALEWLLRLPQQRCLQSEICDLLDVPALSACFGLTEGDLPKLKHWIQGAGIRWGLNQAHRSGLGLSAAGEQNSWIFGIQRMLLGYAVGAAEDYQGIEPYAEIGGLDADLAGSLAEFVTRLIAWRARMLSSMLPNEWSVVGREFLEAFFVAASDNDRVVLMRLNESLATWADLCEQADFSEPVSLAVFREAWLGGLDEASLNQRFISGGVTFCTFMPMRSMPYKVVCLLGMNEGDFPRRAQQVDFDLLALPGMARPGDRSRRDDDRYLMLEALLSARDKLYVSWVGRNIRDNSEQPPSVLISQLQDYLRAGWDIDLNQHTTEYPLQPFSAKYFYPSEQRPVTYATEWGAAHGLRDIDNNKKKRDKNDAATQSVQPEMPITEEPIHVFELEPEFRLKLSELARFIRQPVAYFFQKRLGVIFNENHLASDDEEPFAIDGLSEYLFAERLLSADAENRDGMNVEEQLRLKVQALAREGSFPIGLPGRYLQDRLVTELTPIVDAYQALRNDYPIEAEKLPLMFEHQGIILSDWLDRLRHNHQGIDKETVCLLKTPSKVLDAKGMIRPDKLIDAWLRQLAAAQAGLTVSAYLVARDAVIVMPPLSAAEATASLSCLIELWKKSLDHIYPCTCKTSLALIAGKDPRPVYDGGFNQSGEVDNAYLARVWSDFSALNATPEWESSARALYEPLCTWVNQLQIRPLVPEQNDFSASGVAL